MSAMPASIILEKPAKNLASLVKNEALENLTTALIHQWNIREAFHEVRDFGVKPIDKALFYGPPGNGKTMAAQMIAKEIQVMLSEKMAIEKEVQEIEYNISVKNTETHSLQSEYDTLAATLKQLTNQRDVAQKRLDDLDTQV